MAAIENVISIEDKYQYVGYNGNYTGSIFNPPVDITAKKISITFQVVSQTDAGELYIIRSNNFSIQSSYNYYFIAKIAGNNYQLGSYDNNIHTVLYDGDGIYFDGVLKYQNVIVSISNYPFYLFQYNFGGSYTYNARIYDISVYNNSNTLVNHHIPYYDPNSEVHYLFYETVHQAFCRASNDSSNVYGTASGDLMFDNSNIESIKENETISILGDELIYDTMEIEAKESIEFENVIADGELEYVIADGNQNILLPNYIITSNGKIEITYEVSDYDSTMWLFDMDSVIQCALYNSGGRGLYFRWQTISEGQFKTELFPLSQSDLIGKHTLLVDCANNEIRLDSNLIYDELELFGNSSVSNGNFLLSQVTGLYNFIGKIYSCKIYDQSNLYFDLVPYGLDGTAGFLNVVNNTFLESSSGADFDTEELSVKARYSNKLSTFRYGTVFKHFVDSNLVSKYFLSESKRLGKRNYQYSLFSAIGLLDRQYFSGGLYTGTSLSSVIGSILSNTGIEYSISSDLNSVTVYGWLPYSTKRDALQQVLFATNVHLFKDDNRNFRFGYFDNSSISDIPSSRVFENGSLQYPKLATKVTVVEHGFYNLGSEEETTLFDNTQGSIANNTLIQFNNAPVIVSSLRTTGSITMSNITVNTAVISGQGTIIGKPYTHIKTNIVRNYSGDDDRDEYEVQVTEATLVSVTNSEAVADRVADYYFNYYIVNADVKLIDEKCGLLYSLENTYGGTSTGILSKINKVFSSFVRGSCEFICGTNVSEEGGSSAFTQYALISSDGTWTVPSGIDRIRMIIIGGGSGGSSGYKGEDGDEYHSGGQGGNGGPGGSSGRVYTVTLNVNSGDSLSVSLGDAGIGGEACDSTMYANLGTSGTDTVVTYNGTQYSSARGSSSASGIANIFTGDVYAKPGAIGIAGANGGDGCTSYSSNYDERKAKKGDDVESGSTIYNGGSYGNPSYITSIVNSKTYYAGPGGGGGASATADGSNGGNGNAVRVNYDHDVEPGFDYELEEIHTIGGDGGNGASASARSSTTVYGSGGDGGHGGGGGGGAGNGSTDSYQYENYTPTSSEGHFLTVIEVMGAVGVGGNGGAGGNGAPGCVLIYY